MVKRKHTFRVARDSPNPFMPDYKSITPKQLQRFARENPVAFATLLARIMPTTVRR